MAIARSVRLALALWIVWAIAAWNVAFDRVLVLAGRDYVYRAATAASASRPYALINEWMRPAVSRAFLIATLIGGSILIVGLALIGFAARVNRTNRQDQAKLVN